MQDISLHILDVIENSIDAAATRVGVRLFEDSAHDLLTVEIWDNGRGMDEAIVEKALDPFYSSKSGKRVGLGIPLLAQAAREGGGTFHLDSGRNQGTKITATFSMSHPDTKPTGDVPGTIRMLRLTHPEIEFEYDHIVAEEKKGAEL